MATKSNAEIIRDGLWSNNPALVQVLGLCPLLAVTSTVVNAIGLGLATLLVLMGSNLAVSLIRNFVSDSVRLPAFVMIIASFVTCAELLMQAFTYELYQILGIFIPLIVTNCAILGRADAFASKNPPLPALLDGAMMGLGFLAVLVILGGFRELVGQGTLFTDMDLLLGPIAADWGFRPLANYPDVLFMILPPGAFIGLGLLIAIKNGIDNRLKARQAQVPKEPATTGSKRVRVTGQVS
ncbi:MAG: electron transport complex subunit E [Pseudomonadales bacterium]|uniref:electron transport complex subunit E n=1 Tax=Marinobacter xestospongiae TaxID=994319 RepID=UPI002005EE25|nr:electron transport complex subunit E [Marinobacter xestospongiae]MCG8517009.1 electron transport complex subunit E [Pseudomonadales bacterium]MCK7566805.1 electron transport complex subunit E [Marinobacter xestospongiae]